jgi:hypothetical protein
MMRWWLRNGSGRRTGGFQYYLERRTTMAMEGLTECTAGCGAPISGPGNLCLTHRVLGGVVRVNNSTMVVTVWYAEHGGEAGIILLNDFALGDLFGGRAGFEAELQRQGFTAVHNIATHEELQALKAANKTLARWGGPWLPKYPREISE